MSNFLFSQSWYRVADLKPKLLAHARIHHHRYWGRDWFVLQDQASGRFHRFSPEANLIIGLMDGKRSLEAIWQSACDRLGDHMPTQDEVIALLGQLHRADVLQVDIPPDIAELHRRSSREERQRLLSYIQSPLSLRFPLLDPERFLNWSGALSKALFNPWAALLWGAVVLPALVLAGLHWQDLSSDLADRVLSLENLFAIGLIYPLVKIIHEFGHAYAVRRWGGEVHEMGVMLLVFMPIPYVDASSASAFRNKWQRMLVGAVGILVELFLAAIAMLVWVSVEPGLVRALAYNVMVIAGVSTLLFNGNPLLRYDAYFVLADFLEIPNLAGRSTRYLLYLLQRYLLASHPISPEAEAESGERAWLLLYGLASFVYRLLIMVSIILFVATKFYFVGILFAAWSIVSFVVLPTIKTIQFFRKDAAMKKNRLRAMAVVTSLAVALALMIFVVPLPLFTVVDGVVWVPEQARVHNGSDGFIKEIPVQSGAQVQKGESLVVCENEALIIQEKILVARLEEFQARYRVALAADKTEAEIIEDEIGRVVADLEVARRRIDDLVVRSPTAGVFLLRNSEDMPGRFVRRGTPLGYVVDFDKVTVRTVVEQEDVDLVRHHTQKVEVRLAEDIPTPFAATLVREVPAATKELPSAALGLEGGGTIAMDPREQGNVVSFAKLFQFDITLDLDRPLLSRIDERIYLRFVHPSEPLACRWHRSLRRMLLKRFAW